MKFNPETSLCECGSVSPKILLYITQLMDYYCALFSLSIKEFFVQFCDHGGSQSFLLLT